MTSSNIDVSSPLYVHPSDGSITIVVEKLQGSENYRPWKRSIEPALASKRKLGFVTGAVEKDKTDPILGNENETIKKSVMYMNTSRDKLFHFLNGLDDINGAVRSQLLMRPQLLTAGEACNAIQQEES
ncbi:30S ribosomal protein S2 [Bienertia sinuspersici]